jgi:hypothetical protein
MENLISGNLDLMEIIILLIESAIGTLVLWLLAKKVGKLSNASFLNSWLVVIASYVNYGLFIYFFGINLVSKSPALVSIIAYTIIISASYITFGKLIWKCSWSDSLKANIIWIAFLSIKIALKIEHINLFQF